MNKDKKKNRVYIYIQKEFVCLCLCKYVYTAHIKLLCTVKQENLFLLSKQKKKCRFNFTIFHESFKSGSFKLIIKNSKVSSRKRMFKLIFFRSGEEQFDTLLRCCTGGGCTPDDRMTYGYQIVDLVGSYFEFQIK